MKRFLFALFLIFLLIDIALAFNLFTPRMTKLSTDTFPKSGIIISSDIPHTSATLVNETYLSKKIAELNFFGEGKVKHYLNKNIERVTVKSVRFVITTIPQLWGQRSDSNAGKVVLYSYGQEYNSQTKVMTLFIHIDPSLKPSFPLSQRYSKMILYALFDLIQPSPTPDQDTYFSSMSAFMKDFTSDPNKYNFVLIK